MKKTDWSSGKPKEMLASLQDASPRKLRLFSLACCFSLLRVLDNPECWEIFKVAERFADGRATKKQLSAARSKIPDEYYCAWYDMGYEWREVEDIGFKSTVGGAIYTAAGGTFDGDPEETDAFFHASQTIHWVRDGIRDKPGMPSEDGLQANLLRCIFGNPLRRPNMDPSLVSDSVMKLARTIYKDKVFDRMPILADALEECGVTDKALLAHCRANVPHARGCHVLDLVLGKE